MTALDAELLAALRPEWAEGCTALSAATDLTAARRALARLRGLTESAGLNIVLPLEDSELSAFNAAAPALAAALEKGAAIRTLLVDDSRIIRRLLRDILAADPVFEVVGEAADGAEGLARMAELRPDLTLLDLEMPVLDGFGFLAEWALRGVGEVVVVSSAAQPGSEAALEALRRGAFAAIAKPSGALSPDLATRGGSAILRAGRAACRQ